MSVSQIAFLLLLAAAFGFFGYTARRIYSYFRLTKPEDRVDRIGERISLTLKVAFGQSKMLRKIVAGGLHALVFWGFLVITVGTAEMILDGVAGIANIPGKHRILGQVLGPLYDVITVSGELFALIVIISCVLFLIRRYIIKPARFTAPEMKPSSRMDATFILGMILMLMFSLLLMNMGHVVEDPALNGSYPVSRMLLGIFPMGEATAGVVGTVNWWIHITLVLAFLNILPLSKHFHVILAIPNVFFSNLEVRGKLENLESVKKEVKLMMSDDPFAAPPEGGEESTEVSRFGIKDVEDISWKDLMNAYTCTECGRCTASCPANITGKKLSPRKLYIDLRARMSHKGPEMVKAGGQPVDDGKSLVGDLISEEELWACTSCAACMQECPVNIEHIPFIVSMRQYLVMEESKAPEALNVMFANIENNGAPWAMAATSRHDWANEIYYPED
jgi:heterodisulfide reductase subunit C